MTRSKVQREQDRTDLLAALTDTAAPMWTDDVIGAAHGLRPGETPGYTQQSRGRTDLAALERQGLIVRERGGWSHHARWSLVSDVGALTQREMDRDVDDLRRQMADWEPADDPVRSREEVHHQAGHEQQERHTQEVEVAGHDAQHDHQDSHTNRDVPGPPHVQTVATQAQGPQADGGHVRGVQP